MMLFISIALLVFIYCILQFFDKLEDAGMPPVLALLFAPIVVPILSIALVASFFFFLFHLAGFRF